MKSHDAIHRQLISDYFDYFESKPNLINDNVKKVNFTEPGYYRITNLQNKIKNSYELALSKKDFDSIKVFNKSFCRNLKIDFDKKYQFN